MLAGIERQMGRVYETNPALLNIQKKYEAYMDDVSKRTEDAYKAFMNAEDEESKKEAKEAYMGQIRAYTIQSKEYNKIIKEFVHALALANQKAMDVVNDSMVDIYVMNYNQVADDCRKVGIKVK